MLLEESAFQLTWLRFRWISSRAFVQVLDAAGWLWPASLARRTSSDSEPSAQGANTPLRPSATQDVLSLEIYIS